MEFKLLPGILTQQNNNDNPTAFFNLQKGQVIKANPLVIGMRPTKSKTSYFRMPIKADLDFTTVEICLNTGSSDNLVNKEWV